MRAIGELDTEGKMLHPLDGLEIRPEIRALLLVNSETSASGLDE
jgi:hypothetical protein